MRRKVFVGIGAVALGVAGIGAIVAAAASDDDGANVTGQSADAAVSAALAATGGGQANSVERDSEDGATWEVEVTKPDGATVDVRLDAGYHVVVIEPDSE